MSTQPLLDTLFKTYHDLVKFRKSQILNYIKIAPKQKIQNK